MVFAGIDEAAQVTLPPGQEPMHLEDVVGRQRVRALCHGRGHFAEVPGAGIGGQVCVADEPECGAPAGPTLQLEECHVVPVGEDADPLGGDRCVADGAADAVQERSQVIAGIHPRGV